MWHRSPIPEDAPGGSGGVVVWPDDPAAWPETAAEIAATGLSVQRLPTSYGDLHDGLAAFRVAHPAGVYSAKRTIDPLLDVWALAAAVDPNVARPIEAVLVTLVERTVITAGQLSACMDEVEAVVARLSP